MAKAIVIIGGGPGGYTAAIRAAQLGASVTLVERAQVGGTCLNCGCIPTKTLVYGAHILDQLAKAQDYGIKAENVEVDFNLLMRKKDQVVTKLVSGIQYLLKKNKVTLLQGEGRLLSPDHVVVESENGRTEVRADAVIIATGTEPALISSLGYDGRRVITSNEALALEELPESMLIIGGGVIGCEFAGIFAALGVKVSIVELMPSILPQVDRDIVRHLQAVMRRRGVTVKTGAKIVRVEKDEREVRAVLETGECLAGEKMLISIGRVMNTSSLGLKECGVLTGGRDEILVDGQMRTSVPGVFAAGDVTGRVQLAHVASAQGLVAVDNIMGNERNMDYDAVPGCIFTAPEIAGVGLTTQEAEARGILFKTGRFPFTASGKALAMNEAEGFVKILADYDGRIIGVHIMGPGATELIAEATLAIRMGVTVDQFITTIHAHPTLAEALLEAVESVHGLSIHI